MLSKIWKKLLLAICIIAILFNITSKLVNRISLEKTIESSPEGIDVRELLNIEEEPVVENATTSHYNAVTEDSVKEQNLSEVNDEVINNEITEVPVEESIETSETDTGEVEEQDSSNKDGIFDITDISEFTTLLY